MSGLDNIYSSLSLESLELEQLDSKYQDLYKSRGDNPLKRIKRQLLSDSNHGEFHCLLAGFRGSGKSTELVKMQQEIQDKFLVLNLSIKTELDPINFNYTNLIILMMEKLFKCAEENELPLNSLLLESIHNWTATEEFDKVKSFSSELKAEVGGDIKFTIPFFSKFFASIRGVSNVNYNAKETINRVIEHQLSDLIDLCNDTLRDIRYQLFKIDKELLIIIEDTDKLSYEKAQELFYTHSPVFRKLRTNLVFTFPIALKCSQLSNIIIGIFDNNVFELPMVKINFKDGTPNQEAIDDLTHLISKRIDVSLFDNKEIVTNAILKSGGCIRDLFRLIRDAADSALDDDRLKINEADFNTAYMRLKRAYKETIAEKRTENGVITAEQYYATLKKLAISTTKQLDNNEEDLDLRHNLCILGYNGEGWYDVHPAVKDLLLERETNA